MTFIWAVTDWPTSPYISKTKIPTRQLIKHKSFYCWSKPRLLYTKPCWIRSDFECYFSEWNLIFLSSANDKGMVVKKMEVVRQISGASLEGAKGAKSAFQILVKRCVFITAVKINKMCIRQKTLMCLQPKNWSLIGKPPYRSLTFTQEYSFQWKNSIFLVDQRWCKANFFKISWLKLQKLI